MRAEILKINSDNPESSLIRYAADQIRAGEVKALFFPADEPVDMRISTLERGRFTLDVFLPSRAAPCHFGPLALDPGDRVHMTMLAGEINLYYGHRVISSGL